MHSSHAKENFQRIVAVLERALRVLLTTPKEKREIPIGDRFIITMLGFVHQLIGNKETALRLYNEGLARYPNEPALLTFRGLAQIDVDRSSALSDFRIAVQAGSRTSWAYSFLANVAHRNHKLIAIWSRALQYIDATSLYSKTR